MLENFYTKQTLGFTYTKEKTIFKLWAPTAKAVNLLTFKENTKKAFSMKRSKNGVFTYTLKNDNLNLEYLFEVIFDNFSNITVDPYSKATTVNGKRSVVLDITKNDTSFQKIKTPIIYELSVRDISSFYDSGIENKGKFIGLCEKNTKTKKGQITGLDYIKDLGVTYIQLMPIFDFSQESVDEENQFEKYNWGYDPVNYNTPDGSFASNPYIPNVRIDELKKLVKTMHDNNIGVIMDVVYNHVFDAKRHSFELTVPGYFFRLDKDGNFTNGTFCGNDVASEHKMVRKYIVDSLKYLMSTYMFDGFRFDLMGILDITTMKMVYKELKKINPDVLILGEGWDMGTLESHKKASQNNAKLIPNISFFNDDIRDLIKGSTFECIGKGFVNGKEGLENMLIQNIKGGFGIKTYKKPSQVIQYVEAHDNLTLFDQLKHTNPDDNISIIEKRHRLATTIALLSNGIPFIHSGQEFLRTKKGDENSYKSAEDVNWVDYDRALMYKNNVDFVKEIIKIRKAFPVFTLNDYNEIEKRFKVLKSSNFVISYKIDDIFVIYNANESDILSEIENGNYTVLARDDKANVKGLDVILIKDNKIKVNKLSLLILKKY